MKLNPNIKTHLQKIYKDQYKEDFLREIQNLLDTWSQKNWDTQIPLSEKNVYLITYGDSVYEKDIPTLQTLHKFAKEYIGDTISDIHLLPMFEYSSDDGFSVIDYRKVDPVLGNWEDLDNIAQDYRLMYDFVANHISQHSDWFKAYLCGDEQYKNYFIEEDSDFNDSLVVRPRTSPLFHPFMTKNGERKVWTTFSDDQIDLNVKHFPVLLEMIDILLMYAHRGATSIRLDAIGFLWKESATSCIHLDETHEIIKLWRTILDDFKPNLQIITETNVPHKENISYFGNGQNEAHQVYQFTLPPLVLHSFTTHNSKKISEWAKTIPVLGDRATFFNFLSSHDGIGLRPVEGLLTKEEIQGLVDKVLENGGKVNYKNNIDGTQSPYELNVNYQDALLNLSEDTTDELQIAKIVAAHAILLSIVGVPAFYYNSLLGSRNDYKGLEESGINRRINREKFEYNALKDILSTDSRREQIFTSLKNIINIRKSEPAFHPYNQQEVLDLGDERIFTLKRGKGKDSIIFIVNLSSDIIILSTEIQGTDIVTKQAIEKNITLTPYQFLWIK